MKIKILPTKLQGVPAQSIECGKHFIIFLTNPGCVYQALSEDQHCDIESGEVYNNDEQVDSCYPAKAVGFDNGHVVFDLV